MSLACKGRGEAVDGRSEDQGKRDLLAEFYYRIKEIGTLAPLIATYLPHEVRVIASAYSTGRLKDSLDNTATRMFTFQAYLSMPPYDTAELAMRYMAIR